MDNDTADEGAEEFVPGYKTRDDAVAALAAAKSAQEQLKALQEEKHRLLEQMLTARDGFGDVKPTAKAEAPTLELPDPLEDRVAFAKALMQNIRQQQDATLSAAEARKAEEQRRIEAATSSRATSSAPSGVSLSAGIIAHLEGTRGRHRARRTTR